MKVKMLRSIDPKTRALIVRMTDLELSNLINGYINDEEHDDDNFGAWICNRLRDLSARELNLDRL